MRAQTAGPNVPAKPPGADQFSQAELLESFRQLREQLRAAQLEIVNNRLESEAAARTQARSIAEKLDAFNAAIATERQRQQAEADRVEYERQREQLEAMRINRATLWIVSAFGTAGLLAMLLTARLQWRAVDRMADVFAARPPGRDYDQPSYLPEPAAAVVSPTTAGMSAQRLLSAIDRMEQRIGELESMSAHPFPPGPSGPLERPKQAMA